VVNMATFVQQFNRMEASSSATRGAPEISRASPDRQSTPRETDALMENLLYKITQRIARRAGETKGHGEFIKSKSSPDIVKICHVGEQQSFESQDDASTWSGSSAFSRFISEPEEVNTEVHAAEMDDCTWQTQTSFTFPSEEASYKTDSEDVNHETIKEMDHRNGLAFEEINYEAEVHKVYGWGACSSISYSATGGDGSSALSHTGTTYPSKDVDLEADIKRVYSWTAGCAGI